MKNTQRIMLALTCLAVFGLMAPTVAAESVPASGTNDTADDPGDCARLNEDGTIYFNVPACYRMIMNITVE